MSEEILILKHESLEEFIVSIEENDRMGLGDHFRYIEKKDPLTFSIFKMWYDSTRKMLISKNDETSKLEAKIEKVEEVNDMKDLIISGMRRVLAVSRMVNAQNPDTRMTQALSAYDRNKLSKQSEGL